MEKTEILYIYGAGGHGLVCADIAKAIGYKKIIFLDDDKNKAELSFNKNLAKNDIFVAIGNAKIREKISNEVENSGFNLVSLIHPSAIISSCAQIQKGVCVMPNAIINAKAQIQKGSIINSGAIVEHECCIGKFSHICPNSALAGNVKIGNFVWFGISSCAIENISIGQNSFIGAGSVVIKSIPPNTKAFGNPAKVKINITK